MGKIFFARAVILVILLSSAFVSCPKFKRNPNLRLLLKEENCNLLNPRWTKSGWVYYIKYYADGAWHGSGEIWRIKDNGDGNKIVLPDTFSIIDVSPSETLLVGVISYNTLPGPMVLYNLKTTTAIETLAYNVRPYAGVKFGSTDTFIYYSPYHDCTLHRINIYTHTDSVILQANLIKFDIYRDSLIYYVDTNLPAREFIFDIINSTILYRFSGIVAISFVPNYPDSLIQILLSEGMRIYDVGNGEIHKLDADPYERTCWMTLPERADLDFDPTGQKIIFSASGVWGEKLDDGYPFELWILEKF